MSDTRITRRSTTPDHGDQPEDAVAGHELHLRSGRTIARQPPESLPPSRSPSPGTANRSASARMDRRFLRDIPTIRGRNPFISDSYKDQIKQKFDAFLTHCSNRNIKITPENIETHISRFIDTLPDTGGVNAKKETERALRNYRAYLFSNRRE